MQESGLHRVIDPAGGAPFVEELTRRLAHEAWSLFQAIEGGGGMNEMLMRGTPQDWIATTQAERMANVARRHDAIVGVSEFPDLAERAARDGGYRHGGIGRPREAKLGGALDTRGISFADLVERSLAGEALPLSRPPRQLHGAAAAPGGRAFEHLRDRSDDRLAISGSRPRIFICCLGSAADHGARLSFRPRPVRCRRHRGRRQGPAGRSSGHWRSLSRLRSGCALRLGRNASAIRLAAVPAMKAAGCERVWVMGRPAPVAQELVEAGATGCVRAGDDILAILEDAYAFLDENP